MNAIQVIVIGLISFLGLIWQFWLTDKDISRKKESGVAPRRLYVPLVAGFLIVLGAIVYCIIVRLDPRKASIAWPTLLLWCSKAFVFALVINLKSYFGPLVVSFVASSELYYLMEYGEWHPVPLLSALADWVFEFGPHWVSIAYLVVQTVYCFATSTAETAFHEVPAH